MHDPTRRTTLMETQETTVVYMPCVPDVPAQEVDMGVWILSIGILLAVALWLQRGTRS
jgi:hypothetical protein